jgi:hypothetical protein
MDRPIVSFDTSVVNRLAKHTNFVALRTKINDAYHVRMNRTVIAELVSTEAAELRAHLLNVERMLRCPGDITFPHDKILESSIRFFEEHRSNFEWKRVSIRSKKMEEFLADTFLDDGRSADQRKQFSDLNDQWIETFQRFSDSFNENVKDSRPTSLDGLVELLEREDGAILQAWGKMLYKKHDGTDGSAECIRQFYELCPPFRAMVMVMLVQQWERCFRDLKLAPSFRAGRNDMIMATYLPYCNVFVCDRMRR